MEPSVGIEHFVLELGDCRVASLLAMTEEEGGVMTEAGGLTPTISLRLSRLPVEKLSKTRTLAPFFISLLTRLQPIKPAPPVTRIFLFFKKPPMV
ncbi:hypothetical protein ES705_22453 [subsurface metagenome]